MLCTKYGNGAALARPIKNVLSKLPVCHNITNDMIAQKNNAVNGEKTLDINYYMW